MGLNKILVFGAGVVGTTYAWQLSESGYDVSLLVRKLRMVRYSHSGVNISCTDERDKKTQLIQTVFRPQTVDRLDPKENYDLIIVALKGPQLNDSLPYLSKYAGRSPLLFLGSIWGEFGLIRKHLHPARCFYGFPGMIGGGHTDSGIQCHLFSNGNTMLGEANGKTSQRLRETAEVLGQAGMRPRITPRIIPWIRAHTVWECSSFGAICKAGGTRPFAMNTSLIRQAAKAMREGLDLSKRKGMGKASPLPWSVFRLPHFLLVPWLKKSYTDSWQQLFDMRMHHGFDEFSRHYLSILRDGQGHKLSMPYWTSFEKYVLEEKKKRRD